jgi:hypothetical protein
MSWKTLMNLDEVMVRGPGRAWSPSPKLRSLRKLVNKEGEKKAKDPFASLW